MLTSRVSSRNLKKTSGDMKTWQKLADGFDVDESLLRVGHLNSEVDQCLLYRGSGINKSACFFFQVKKNHII